ncbi:MAG TPA: hypothetical protein VGM77_04975 [Gemmatimonadales bacterium]|jgi:hypothetical protein
MRSSTFTAAVFLLVGSTALGAQAPVTMPSGNYVIEARDSSKTDSIGMMGWPLVLKGNGTFSILTMPDSLMLMGKLIQKGGMATLTEQTCTDGAGTYFVRKVRSGYAFDVKTEACVGRDSAWSKLLFVPGKPKK